MLTGVYVIVFLQMSQLCKALAARFAFERPFAGVRSQMDFQVGQLTERLAAHVALVVHFTVFLADRIRQRPVTARVARAAGAAARRHVVRRRHGTRRRTAGTGLDRVMVAGVMALVPVGLRREQMRLMVVVRHVLDLLAGRGGVDENRRRRAPVGLVQRRRHGRHHFGRRVRAHRRVHVALRVRRVRGGRHL